MRLPEQVAAQSGLSCPPLWGQTPTSPLGNQCPLGPCALPQGKASPSLVEQAAQSHHVGTVPKKDTATEAQTATGGPWAQAGMA